MNWPRPIPTIGDTTSAADRAATPDGWAFGPTARESLYEIIGARRDVRRFRPNPVLDDVLHRVLQAAHQAPSVGHSQPWRFIVVTHSDTRQRAALLADRERLAQAAQLEPSAARHLLDLQLDGIREAPIGIVVCCDRRTAGAGVLGRATFDDADVWSCACAIQNLWLAARAEGLGLGWVTLFQPDDLAQLVGLPDGVVSLGWLCLGWPDERQPSPGLERAGWSSRQPLAEVVCSEHWPETATPAPPSKLRAPQPAEVVRARDSSDVLLTPSGSLGILDRVIDRVRALRQGDLTSGCLVLVGGDHPVADLGVSAFDRTVTAEVLAAAQLGEAVGTVAARSAGLCSIVINAGASTGDLLNADALSYEAVEGLLLEGRVTGRAAAARGAVVLGEVGIGNTTVAAALSAVLLSVSADEVVGLGASADSAMLARKREVVRGALLRARTAWGVRLAEPTVLLAALGGPEFAYLTGVVMGAVEYGQVVILDGLATSVAALCAQLIEPAVGAHLVAGQRSREHAHPLILGRLGLEPLLDLRLRSGEGVGGCLAAGLIFSALAIRRESGRVDPQGRAT
jgi:nicotinate-nucleotide--dimethylbenzimidazole phosphoribosyltransferase